MNETASYPLREGGFGSGGVLESFNKEDDGRGDKASKESCPQRELNVYKYAHYPHMFWRFNSVSQMSARGLYSPGRQGGLGGESPVSHVEGLWG